MYLLLYALRSTGIMNENTTNEFETMVGVRFSDESLLFRALTHRSYVNENPDQVLEDNERLEFLGDAVLDFVVGAYLYERYPAMPEGELTSLRAALVRTETLALLAQVWQLDKLLLLGHGEAENGGRTREPTLCAAFEAVIGAIYLDQGLSVVREVLLTLMEPRLAEIIELSLYKDAKSEFQVWAQAKRNVTPRYKVVSEAGPDHAKEFTAQVLLDKEVWGEGVGRSKQRAQQAAAQKALDWVRAMGVEDIDG